MRPSIMNLGVTRSVVSILFTRLRGAVLSFRGAGWFLFLVAITPLFGTAHERDRRLIDLGWEEDFGSLAEWREEPWLASPSARQSTSSVHGNGFAFTVPDGDLEGVWTRTASPIWTADFPFLELDYTVSGTLGGNGKGLFLLSDDSTGPVTPGALNPENPFASGSTLRVGTTEPGRHRSVLFLKESYRSDRVGRISIRFRSGDEPASVVLHRLAFWATDPNEEWGKAEKPADGMVAFESLNTSRDESSGPWKPISLPISESVSLEGLRHAFRALDWPIRPLIQAGGAIFRPLEDGNGALATGIQKVEKIEMAGEWEGTELALLLATRRFGSDSPWYSARSSYERSPLDSPHELSVELEYADGRRKQHFPWSCLEGDYQVSEIPAPYVVPLEQNARLASIRICDKMEYGQVFLLGASVNQGPPLQKNQAGPVPGSSPPLPFSEHGRIPPLTHASNLIRVSDATGNLIQFDPISMSPQETLTEGPGAKVNRYAAIGDDLVLSATMDTATDGTVRMTPSLVSSSRSGETLEVLYPVFEGIRIAKSPENSAYLLGTRNTILGTASIDLQEPYSGGFPLQFLDLFDQEEGGGLAVWIEDRDLHPKVFHFNQQEGAATLSVRFPGVRLEPDLPVELPTVALFPHEGDWHEPFNRYRTWVRSTSSADRTEGLKNLFFCRRDYPVGGTGYLYDLREKRYTPARLLEESQASFGGADFIDVSGWAYNEATGRVGDYLKNDLGGLSELARGIEEAHLLGSRVGLYFEGYLLDQRCELAPQALPSWQLVAKEGDGRWWSGDMEFFTCPGVPAWREAFSGMVAEVAAQTGADAVYVDQFGFGGPDKACYSPDHGHPVPSNPLVEERKMLQIIRTRLEEKSPKTALYTEQVPCDGYASLIDAAFNYGMASSVEAVKQHPTQLPLLRYVFPEIAVIEMVGHGIRPYAVSVDDLHLCLFHGLAVWLKGRGASWFSPQFRDFAKKIHPILRNHSDLLRSPDCEPLIPTLLEGVYANRFGAGERVLITVYNARYSGVEGEIVAVEGDYSKAANLLERIDAAPRRSDGRTILAGALDAKTAGVFLLER